VTDQPAPKQDTCGAIGSLDGPLPGSTGRCYRRPHHDPHHRDQNGCEWDAPACGEECAEGHTYAGRCTQATPGAPRPDDPDWNSPEDAVYDSPDTARTTPDNPAASNNETDNNRRALACNAIAPVLRRNGQWLPLNVRLAIADEVLAALDGPADTTPPAGSTAREAPDA
jgi:hypothetical protein